MMRLVIEGLMLGLSSGVYCAGTCLVFFMPYLLAEGKSDVVENSKKILFFLSGRLLAYIAFAFIMGLLKSASPNIFTAKFSHISLIIVSLLLLVYALINASPDWSLCKLFIRRFNLMRIPFFLGFFTGLNPCLPFIVGVARLLTLNSILGGVVMFIAFFLGTSVYMIPLIFVSYLNRLERLKTIGLILAMLSGIWFLFVGISGLIG